MQMSGRCCNRDEAAAEKRPIALACYVVQLEAESDGYGMQKITFGRRSFPISKSDGSTSTPAKKSGTIPDCMRKVGIYFFVWIVTPSDIPFRLG
jgi:hypothetical protein